MKALLLVCLTAIGLTLCDAASALGDKPYIEPSAVFCFALSPDGKTLALAERQLTIRLWSVGGRKDIRTFPIGGPRDAYISRLAFSPDGKELAVAGSGRLEIWDVESGKLRRTFNNLVKGVFRGAVKEIVAGPDDPAAITIPDNVHSVVYSGDGRKLFASGLENFIRVWDPATGKEMAKWVGHESPVTHLALSRDGKTLASGTFYGEVKIWNVENSKELASWDNNRSVYGLALSADGKRLLSTNGVNVTLWDVDRKRAIRMFKGVESEIGPVAFSPNEKLVVAWAIDFTIWDANTSEKIATLRPVDIPSLVISPDSRTLFSCDRKGKVTLLDLPRR